MNQLAINKQAEAIRLVDSVLVGVTNENTKMAYSRWLLRFIAYCHANNQRPTREIVQAWKGELKEQGKSAATINQALSAVRQMVNELAARGELPAAAAQSIAGVKSIPIRGGVAKRWLSPKESMNLIASVRGDSVNNKQRMAMIALLMGCAMRRGEVSKLKWEDVIDDGWVNAYVNIRGGKGNKDRPVPAANWVMVALNEWAEVSGREGYVIAPVNQWEQVNKDATPISPRAIEMAVKKMCKSAGLGAVNPHDLRRTWARRAYTGGMNINEIRLILGHKSISTTQEYIGLNQVDLETPKLLEFDEEE